MHSLTTRPDIRGWQRVDVRKATKGNAGQYGAVGQGLRELAVRFKVGWSVSKTNVSFRA